MWKRAISRKRLGDRLVGGDLHRIEDHAGFGALHPVDLCGCCSIAHVAVHDAKSAEPCQRDRET